MDKRSKSNNWIEEVFKSVQHQKQPTLRADLFSKIEQRINIIEVSEVLIPVWKIAVAVAIIVTMNLLALNYKGTNKQSLNSSEYELISNYNLYTDE